MRRRQYRREGDRIGVAVRDGDCSTPAQVGAVSATERSHDGSKLIAAGMAPGASDALLRLVRLTDLLMDSLIGYSLAGPPHGRAAELIALCNASARRVLALDVPSGLDAATGEAPGLVVRPNRILTLALPKTGLARVPGDLYLADIGIPPEVHARLGIALAPIFGSAFYVSLGRQVGAAKNPYFGETCECIWFVA